MSGRRRARAREIRRQAGVTLAANHPARTLSRARPLAPWAGVAASLSVVVTLNLVAHPLVSAATGLGLALLALYLGHRRLVVTAVATGIGLVILEPVLVHVFGGGLAAASSRSSVHGGVAGPAWLAAAAMRVPAQVLACLPLLLVQPEEMISWIGRVAPRAAFAAAIASRIGPVLRSDALRAREHVRAGGGRLVGPLDPNWQAPAWRALWHAVAGGAFDRAATTAVALEARGFGSATPTTERTRHPALGGGKAPGVLRDALVVTFAVAAVIVAIVGRANDIFESTSFDVFAGAASTIGAVSFGLASTMLALAVVLADPSPRRRLARTSASAATSSGNARPQASAAPDYDTDASHGEALASTQSPPVVPAAPILRVRGLQVRHPGATVPAIDGIDLDVAAGELVVVAGSSGSGKSTFLDAIAGIAPHATGGYVSGSVELDGRPILTRNVAARSCDVAIAMQEPERQVLATTVAAEVQLGLRLHGLPIDEIERRTLAVLTDGGLLHLARRSMTTLSGGELQRVLLAAALASRPRLLLLDEPTAQLDAAAARAFWIETRRLARASGTAVLATEHRLDLVAAVADRVIRLDAAAAPVESVRPSGRSVPGAPRLVARGMGVHIPDGTRTLVSGFDLVGRAGDVIVVRGDNGSGKSTLLRALRGLHAHGGTVTLDGMPRCDVESWAAQCTWLSQRSGVLLAAATVREAVLERARHWHVPIGTVDAELADAGLLELADRNPLDISVGQRQRLAICAATLHRPPVWLLDEPTRGMDMTAIHWLESRIAIHVDRGGVVVVVSHDPDLCRGLVTQLVDLTPRSDWRSANVDADQSRASRVGSAPGVGR